MAALLLALGLLQLAGSTQQGRIFAFLYLRLIKQAVQLCMCLRLDHVVEVAESEANGIGAVPFAANGDIDCV